MTLYPLRIPLRGPVEHAQAQREVADPIVVKVELAGGGVGYGETLARPYVTGETRESVLQDVQGPLLGAAMAFHADTFSTALEAMDTLPWRAETGSRSQSPPDGPDDSGTRPPTGFHPLPAARAAVELALLDASMRHFDRSMSEVAGWMGLTFAAPEGVRPRRLRSRRLVSPRFSGVLASTDERATLRQLRLMRWAGLRDIKLKVGDEGDDARLRATVQRLRKGLSRGVLSLRLDANGAWTLDAARARLKAWEDLPLSGVEQPLPKGSESQLVQLRSEFDPLLIHDESLVTVEDAQRLIDLNVADMFNIRLSKCGGMLPSLRLAALAWRAGTAIQLGCMVGETSILAAAGLRFLELCPRVEWAEGCFGTRLLGRDVTRRSLRFGYGGRPPKLESPGWGVDVQDGVLALLSDPAPIEVHLG